MQPDRLRLVTFTAALVLAASAVGCVKPWNTAHAGLEAGAEAVTATDRMVATMMTPRLQEARERVVSEAREARQQYEACASAEPPRDDCGEPPTVEEYMERYEEEVASWEAVTTALEVIREVLILAESAITVWRDTKEQPDNWSHICQRIGESQAAVVRAIEACGVEVPEQWQAALGALQPVCEFVAPDPPEPSEKGQGS